MCSSRNFKFLEILTEPRTDFTCSWKFRICLGRILNLLDLGKYHLPGKKEQLFCKNCSLAAFADS